MKKDIHIKSNFRITDTKSIIKSNGYIQEMEEYIDLGYRRAVGVQIVHC